MSEQFDRLVAWQCGDTSSRGAHSSVESMVVLWEVSYNQGRGNKVLLVSVMQEGWVERNFFFIFIIHLFGLGLRGSTRDPLLRCMGSAVVTQGLSSCSSRAWLLRWVWDPSPTVHVHLLNHVWLFATQWTVAHQTHLSVGFPRQERRSGLPFPPPKGLPNPGIKPTSPALQDYS